MQMQNVISVLFLVFFAILWGEQGEAQSRGRRAKGAVTPTGIFVRKGIYADMAYFFGSNQVTSDTVNSSYNQSSFLDVKLGYINQAAFYYGAQYTIRNDATRTTSTQGRGSGFGIGYFWVVGFDVRAYYRFHETFGDYRSGTGYQVDFGYTSRIYSNFYMGVIIDYREIKYETYTLDTRIRNTVISTLQPSISIGYLF